MKSTIGVGLWSMQQMIYVEHKTVEDVFKAVAKMGVDSIDLYEDFIPCHPVRLYELHKIKKQIHALGLDIKCTWFMNDVIGASQNLPYEKVVDNFREYIAVTAELGAKCMTVPFLCNVPNYTLDQGYEFLLKFFADVLPTAEEYDVLIGHELAREATIDYALRLRKEFNSKYYTLSPDFESWRMHTSDLPLVHAESPDAIGKPATIEKFIECLPYSPYIHFKMLKFDQNGEEPHFPMKELMQAINHSKLRHHLCIEYEGWIPDVVPDFDGTKGTQLCVDLIKRYQKDEA